MIDNLHKKYLELQNTLTPCKNDESRQTCSKEIILVLIEIAKLLQAQNLH